MVIQKMIVRILTFILVSQSIYAQGIFSKSISLKIYEDSLVCVNACNTLTISLILNNDSNDDILVYGLSGGGPYPAPFSLSELCDVKSVGTGIAFALYRSDGIQKMPEIEIADRFGQKEVTREMLDSALYAVRTHFLKSAMILKRHEERSFVKQVPLENFNLQKGLYYLQIVYYCGGKTADILDLNEVKTSGAKLFQGCTSSLKIPFVVN